MTASSSVRCFESGADFAEAAKWVWEECSTTGLSTQLVDGFRGQTLREDGRCGEEGEGRDVDVNSALINHCNPKSCSGIYA